MPACLRRSTRLAMVLSLAGAVCAAPARAQSTRAVEGLFSANASILWPAATSVTLSTVADDPPDRAEEGFLGPEHRPHNRKIINLINDICVKLAPQWSDGIIVECGLS